jgi:phage gp36-like protein
MSYCLTTDIYTAPVPPATDATGRGRKWAEEVATADIQGYIDGVDALIDATLRSRYTVPFATTPAIIKEISLRLACCQIIMMTQENFADDKVTDPLKMCAEAKQWLEDLASGKLSIDAELSIDSSLLGNGIAIKNIPIDGVDEVETDKNKMSQFYRPISEPPPVGI